jgi:hypothetical protein
MTGVTCGTGTANLSGALDELIKCCKKKKKFEDTKGVIRSCKSKKDRQHNGQKKKDKRKSTIYKTLYRKLKIEQHERLF